MPEFITEQVVDEQSTPPVAEQQAQEETASAIEAQARVMEANHRAMAPAPVESDYGAS